MEPITTAVAASLGAKEVVAEGSKVGGRLLERLLGESVDVIGSQWAEGLRQKNLQRLLNKTEARANSANPGTVPPRLASQVFDAAQYADEELMAEYFSGVLASARTGNGGNDGGVSWSALISRLSSDQVRLHYLIYSTIRKNAFDSNFKRSSELHDEKVLLPLADIIRACDFDSNHVNRFADAVDGLMRENLISTGYSYGPLDQVQEEYPQDKVLEAPFDRAIRVGLTVHGIRLFIWGLGHGQGDVDEYLNPSAEMNLVDADASPLTISSGGFYKDFLHPKGAN
jgi:hypothetical protein